MNRDYIRDRMVYFSPHESTGFNVHLQWYDRKERKWCDGGGEHEASCRRLQMLNTAEDLSLKTQMQAHWQIESFTM
jgi:hypothetical protein